MLKDDSWLLDMLIYSRQARDQVAGTDQSAFLQNKTLQYALIHLMTVIGEAAAQVSSERRAQFPTIPWGKIVGTRNRLVHQYFKIDVNIVWQIVDTDLPGL